MATRGRVHGPKITKRDRLRISLGQGKVSRRTGKGTRVELDVSPMWLPLADGVAASLDMMLSEASRNAPDDPETQGARIPQSGIWGVYAFGSILASGGPGKWRKPRDFRPVRNGVDGVVTFRSPLHHLHELGTVKMRARPYLGPARVTVAPEVPGILQDHWPKGGPDA